MQTWSKNWTKNGWVTYSGYGIQNKDLVQECYEMYEWIRAIRSIKLTHVRAHLGIPGNEAADRLANLGADQMRL